MIVGVALFAVGFFGTWVLIHRSNRKMWAEVNSADQP